MKKTYSPKIKRLCSAIISVVMAISFVAYSTPLVKRAEALSGSVNTYTQNDITELKGYILGKISETTKSYDNYGWDAIGLATLKRMILSGAKGTNDMRNWTSQQIVTDMGLGWNLGNTLDSCGDWIERGPDGTVEGRNETAWGNPMATEALMKTVKSHGFDSIRIPVTWYENVDTSGKITKSYMDRVQQVVDWALDADLYVVLNMHHEGWLEDAHLDYDAVTAQYTSYWTQIGTRFKDYPDKLIFEAMNEVGFGYDIWNGTYESNTKAYETMTKVSQLFVDTIRSQGGNNAERHLLVAGIWTGIDDSIDPRFKMPVDPAGRLILSFHCYSPSTFCIAEEPDNSWGYRYDWGTPEDFVDLESLMDRVKTNFVDKGIPVIMGEYAVCGVKKDHDSKILWTDTVARMCLERGICPMYWDAGGDIDRDRYKFRDDDLAKVFLTIAGKTKQDSFTVNAKVANEINVSGNVPLDDYTLDLSAFSGKQIVEIRYTLKGSLGKDNDGWTWGGGGYGYNSKNGSYVQNDNTTFNFGGADGAGAIVFDENSDLGNMIQFMVWWGTYENIGATAKDVYIDTMTVYTWETVAMGGNDYGIS